MAQHMRSVHPIPVEVQQLAEIHSLGAPTASYSKLSFNSHLVLLSVLFCLLCTIVWFILSLFSSSLSLLGVASAVGLIIAFIVLYKRWNQKVHIYTEGLVYLRQRKAEALRWEQIETIWYEKPEWFVEDSNDWEYLHIRKTNGIALDIWVKGLSGSSEILATIEREFVRIRLPGMIEQYEAGHSIAFGGLSVNKLGLTYQGETLAWSQVQSIDVGDQRVEIKKEGKKWGNWFNDRVPNQSLLRELVTHIRSSQ